jgi:hypothetical protein
MKYREIGPKHAFSGDIDEPIPSDIKHERMFHPANNEWPLYSIAIWTPTPKASRPAGFFVSLNVKTSIKSDWVACGLMTAQSIPFELLPEVIKLLEEAASA